MIRNLHPERYGTTLWEEAFKGLVNSKQIGIIGLGVKTSPKIVFLIQGESFNTTEVTAAVLSQTPTLEKLLTGHLAMLRDQYLHSLRPL
jgi:hypothetical protein